MQIIIGKKVKQPVSKNEFKIVIEFMHGDADGETFETVTISKDSPYLERFITFLNKCVKTEVYDDEHKEIEDYWLFVEDGLWDSDLKKEEIEERMKEVQKVDVGFSWDYDITYEGNPAKLDSYEITFFDENSIEHEVTIKK